MLLSDKTIRQLIDSGDLVIDIKDPEKQIQPASVDLTLESIAEAEGVVKTRTGWKIYPGARVLGAVAEYIEMPAFLGGRVEGRSSFGREFLIIHSTAAFIDPGFHGKIVLEIANLWHPGHLNDEYRAVCVDKGARVCQICFLQMTTPAEIPYGTHNTSKYQNQSGIVSSRRSEDK